jgi:2-dehydro-3-deoxygluconokinase
MALKVRSKEKCRWDLISLGEVMLRLDPGEKRIWTTRQFEVFEGGGEYNVARGLKRCFGLDTAVVTVFADNPIGPDAGALGALRRRRPDGAQWVELH